MQSVLEFAPLVAFLAAYYVADLYAATAVLMVAMVALLAIDLAREGRIPPLHGLSAVLVLAFGTATLLLRDQRFIQWKPTVFFWVLGVAFLASHWIGAKPLAQRLMEVALGPSAALGAALWRRVNLAWVAFYAALGVLNLAVAFHASERAWVNFKVFGLTLATLLFVAAQVAWLARRLPAESRPGT